MLQEIYENWIIDRMVTHFTPPPFQVHGTHEADAELFDPGEDSPFLLAATIDSLAEEVQSGLYDDPFQMGWMLVMVNFSDLAAVGARPLGILLSLNLPQGTEEEFLTGICRGISRACQKLGTFVLGGDTNTGKEITLTACAVGAVPKETPLMRTGCQPGEYVYLSGVAGIGNAFALQQFSGKPFGIEYLPTARLREGKLVRQYATCCMDTSDGVIHTLDQLMRLNGVRFHIPVAWESIIHHQARQVCQALDIPSWLTLAGFHGEFELCFTIPPGQRQEFLKAARAMNWNPICIGRTRPGQGILFSGENREVVIDSRYIRNLSHTAARNPQEYIQRLIQYAKTVSI